MTGAGYFDADRTDSPTDRTSTPRNVCTTDDLHHANVYLYTLLNWPDTGHLDARRERRPLRQRRRSLATRSTRRWASIWTPLAGHDVRAAVFRTLKRELISNQTIEPTQVAGFNQFFDDVNGTDAWRYGVGIDQKIGSTRGRRREFSRPGANLPVHRQQPGDRRDLHATDDMA